MSRRVRIQKWLFVVQLHYSSVHCTGQTVMIAQYSLPLSKLRLKYCAKREDIAKVLLEIQQYVAQQG